MPLIRHIQGRGHRVFFAGNEWQRSFIRATFKDIDVTHLEGYNVTYSKWNKWGQVGVLSQLPRLNKTISAEYHWLRQTTKDLQIDGIISDNRYGLFHYDIPSVIMTHQLRVQTGMGNIVDGTVQKLHYKYLGRFDTTWIVDSSASPGLGGILSHPGALPKRSRYLGLLSQFANAKTANDNDGSLLVLLSGPEPQRSDLSGILWQQVQDYEGKVTFVECSDTAIPPDTIPENITYHKWLANEQLGPLLSAADMVVSRSGYSTLMDLVALRKKAILIPTPAQTEQEYLGRHLHQQGVFYTAKQKGFDLNNALKEAAQFSYHSMALKGAYSAHDVIIEDWLKTL